MVNNYVEQRDGGFFVEGSRVSLDSVVCAYLRGESPEGIAESFPALRLDQVFGALAYYIANQELIDDYLTRERQEFEALRQKSRQNHAALYAKLAAARSILSTPSR
ncbi:MAG: DUF433 domain-containing protein [Acidobacteria bacterium]|nr:DUF433 domain-containing protein [Acidobacteriota bacterium]